LNSNLYFTARLSEEARRNNFRLILRLATPVPLDISVVQVASEAKDDPILATALNAGADYLVTGDKALLDLGAFEGTRIVTAAEFVAILDMAS
jgi:predicted nucleic acid-binding protein